MLKNMIKEIVDFLNPSIRKAKKLRRILDLYNKKDKIVLFNKLEYISSYREDCFIPDYFPNNKIVMVKGYGINERYIGMLENSGFVISNDCHISAVPRNFLSLFDRKKDRGVFIYICKNDKIESILKPYSFVESDHFKLK